MTDVASNVNVADFGVNATAEATSRAATDRSTARGAGLVNYDPYAYEIHEDPYPTYARLRTEAPLYRNDEYGFWALSRHTDVVEAFKNSDRYSSAEGVTIDPSASGRDAYRSQSFLALDPPRHGRMRALVSRGFTPRRVAELEPRIRELASGYLDELVARESCDFIGEFAGKLPMDVICELIGVPIIDRDEIRRLSDLLVHREAGVRDVPQAGIEAAFTLAQYYVDLIAERRRSPRTDLTSALLEAEIDGDRISDDELLSFLFLMIVAGNETTTKLLGNAWFWGSQFVDQGQQPFNNPATVPAWIEETLRYDTSTQMLARTATESFVMHDREVIEGDRVVLLIGSANRDDRVFSKPDLYDLSRVTTDTVSFGFGRHFCLGASLARLEARVALSELVTRVGSYEIDAAQARRVHSINVRGFAVLPTKVVARCTVV